MTLDPVFLARLQFAFTVSFHIIFPAFTIGLASWLAVMEGLWLKTKKPLYKDLYKFWVKIFAITFGMGVVSGLVMSYQFGMNWSGFSAKIGNVLGPLLGFEVLTAFFLESSFLGIMIFGWDKVSPRVHFLSTLIVAFGTLLSAFWILSANSWMQTPTSFQIGENKVLHPLNWLGIIFNPSFPYRFFHMITAAYLTTSFVAGGVAAWYLLKKKYLDHAKVTFKMAVLMAFLVAPFQIFLGDIHGLNTLKHQPIKVAAMEGLWETTKGADFKIIGWPDDEAEETKNALSIPYLASLVLTHDPLGEVKGLKAWPKEERPPVLPVFLSFRIMVLMGILMMMTGLMGAYLYLRKTLFQTSWFHRWCLLMSPSGFIAVLAGWFVTEIGRQPYVVYGILRTSETSSPVLGAYIFSTLIGFILIYSFIFGAGIYYILRLIRKGPTQSLKEETYGAHGLQSTLTQGDPNV